jgi:hypothetical protein
LDLEEDEPVAKYDLHQRVYVHSVCRIVVFATTRSQLLQCGTDIMHPTSPDYTTNVVDAARVDGLLNATTEANGYRFDLEMLRRSKPLQHKVAAMPISG